jgi:hypothetical protein
MTDAGLAEAVAEAARRIEAAPWALYEVRRVYHAKAGDPAAKGIGWRSVQTLDTGTRAAMSALLAGKRRAEIDAHGVPRQWLRRASAPYPSVEWMLVAGPAGVHDKERPGFAAAWARVTQPQLSLMEIGAAS